MTPEIAVLSPVFSELQAGPEKTVIAARRVRSPAGNLDRVMDDPVLSSRRFS
jgi:hypothetical protein